VSGAARGDLALERGVRTAPGQADTEEEQPVGEARHLKAGIGRGHAVLGHSATQSLSIPTHAGGLY
jgi:hypothetical protein